MTELDLPAGLRAWTDARLEPQTVGVDLIVADPARRLRVALRTTQELYPFADAVRLAASVLAASHPDPALSAGPDANDGATDGGAAATEGAGIPAPRGP